PKKNRFPRHGNTEVVQKNDYEYEYKSISWELGHNECSQWSMFTARFSCQPANPGMPAPESAMMV
ncbi:MAG TPA: hypothetical protein VFC17_02465, partial [Candidatus Limnocylindrales bacterium]|nr:hypothetical protein [Candidatus Limnocylindrales bacterium]